MNNRSHLDDPTYWHKRAKEVRALAQHVGNIQARNDILRIADDYERLAERAKQRARGPNFSKSAIAHNT